MGDNHKKTSFIKSNVVLKDKDSGYIDKNVSLLSSDFLIGGDNASVFLSLRFIQNDFQCFSEWDKNDMSCFWNFNNEVHHKSWTMVYSTAGKKQKTGLAYTPLPLHSYPNSDFKNQLSKDITLFELRLNDKIRVHGFRHKSIFYLCWLDKNHTITSKKSN